MSNNELATSNNEPAMSNNEPATSKARFNALQHLISSQEREP